MPKHDIYNVDGAGAQDIKILYRGLPPLCRVQYDRDVTTSTLNEFE